MRESSPPFRSSAASAFASALGCPPGPAKPSTISARPLPGVSVTVSARLLAGDVSRPSSGSNSATRRCAGSSLSSTSARSTRSPGPNVTLLAKLGVSGSRFTGFSSTNRRSQPLTSLLARSPTRTGTGAPGRARAGASTNSTIASFASLYTIGATSRGVPACSCAARSASPSVSTPSLINTSRSAASTGARARARRIAAAMFVPSRRRTSKARSSATIEDARLGASVATAAPSKATTPNRSSGPASAAASNSHCLARSRGEAPMAAAANSRTDAETSTSAITAKRSLWRTVEAPANVRLSNAIQAVCVSATHTRRTGAMACSRVRLAHTAAGANASAARKPGSVNRRLIVPRCERRRPLCPGAQHRARRALGDLAPPPWRAACQSTA